MTRPGTLIQPTPYRKSCHTMPLYAIELAVSRSSHTLSHTVILCHMTHIITCHSMFRNVTPRHDDPSHIVPGLPVPPLVSETENKNREFTELKLD